MKLLLTSGGITNATIRSALTDVLGRPTDESRALYIPTAMHGHPSCTPQMTWQGIAGQGPAGRGLIDARWGSVGVLELTALPSIARERWLGWVQEADVLLAAGGDTMYLCHWMRTSGLAEVLPELSETVWVGMSAGSMVMTPRIGERFVTWPEPRGDDQTLGFVDFSLFPHLDYPGWDHQTAEKAAEWAETLTGGAYAIDDDTAIRVVDRDVDVVSEGRWLRLGAV
ncbi:Type 1 glutamine amidotransferase-like domain-containing protein [Nesterenkonia sp. K-15-9-6]|uniref:Type 1 glutamine amidotransferase-like domain-containing protein n=1 Tax=Nesterenkonia sp. K-15-9-6 TaxID=3093918 RepID=UPI0040441A3F